jgi:hypothetical protein
MEKRMLQMLKLLLARTKKAHADAKARQEKSDAEAKARHERSLAILDGWKS